MDRKGNQHFKTSLKYVKTLFENKNKQTLSLKLFHNLTPKSLILKDILQLL